MKRKGKRVVAFIMALVVALSGVPVTGEEIEAKGTEVQVYDYFRYIVKSDDTIEIVGYNGENSDIEIPEEICGNKVTSIGVEAFYGCSGLTSIEIPLGVTSIGWSAFEGCSGLTSIEIPSGVTSIGNGAFEGCSGLTSIKVSLENTVYDSLNNCNAIIEKETNKLIAGCKNTSIPESVTSIGVCAFSGCSGLTSIEIPSGVTSIGYNAFSGCSGLTSIEIPSGVTSIGYNAFSGCRGLTSIEIPSGVTSIESGAFSGCSGLTSIEIPSGVTSIGYNAFSGCSGLTSIEIPSGVTSIGYNAFSGCRGLTSIEIPSGVTSIESGAFSGCSGLTSIEIPSGVTSIGYSAFDGCSGLTSIEIPSGVTSIGYDAFDGCSGLTSIEIPSGVTSIGGYAFKGCSGLTSIEIPPGVTSIGDGTFFGCSGLTSIEIPSGVTSIGEYAFYGCSGLTSIEIPSGVTSIGGGAFSGCSGLTSIEIPSGVTSIEGYAFSGCSGLTSIEIPSGVTGIGGGAFSGCSGLTSIEIPSGVTSIGGGAFSGCSGLTSIEIPSGVTSIGGYAFDGCSGLTSIEIPSGVTSIGYRAFFGCSGLTSIEIPSGVTSIGGHAFSGCSSLTSIEIPPGVTSIGDGTFSGCSSLTSIEIPSGVTSIGGGAFSGCSSLTIYCYKDSQAYYYAKNRGIDYILIGIDNTTPTLTSNTNITFSVYDIGNGKSVAKPMKDAQITVDGFGNTTTDMAGKAEIGNILKDKPVTNTKITLAKEGYRTYYYYKDIYQEGIELLWNNNQNYVLMRKLQEGDEVNPYVSTLMCQPQYGNSYDAMTIQKTYNSNGSGQKLNIQLNAVWNGKTPASYILYQKNGKSYESTDGKFSINMGDFSAKYPIYAKLVATDGTTVEEKTQFVIEGNEKDDVGYSLDLIDTGSSCVMGEDVALLSGETVGIELKNVNIEVSVENGKVKVMVGRKITSKDELFSNEKWEEWKKLCEHQPKDLNMSQWKNVLDSIDTPVTANAKAKTEVYGYMEGTLVKNGDTMVAGKIKLSTSLSAGIQSQYTVGVIPVYAKVSLGVDAGAEGKLTYNFTQNKIDSEKSGVTLTIGPTLKAEGGVGVMAVATVGVEGTGSMPVTVKIGTNDATKCSLKAKMALKAKLLAFEYSLNLAEREINIFPGEEPQNTNLSGASMDDFRLSDRKYTAKGSTWLGNQETLARTASSSGGTERVLKTNIYPDSELQIVNVGNTKMIFWTEEDTTRDNINDSKLVYSIYDTDSDTWSEPLAVADDGTADYAPTAVSDGERVYVAWQNITEKLDSSSGVEDMAAAASIAMSVWTKDEGFSDVVTMSEKGKTVMLPKIALDKDGNPFVAYIQNTDNNLLITTGTNSIVCAIRKGDTTEYKNMVADAGMVNSLSTAYTNDYEISYTVDKDGDLSTLEDREVCCTNGEATDNECIDSNVQYVKNGDKIYRFWYQEGTIKMLDTSGNETTVYQDDTGKLTDDFTVVSGQTNQMAVIWTATDDETHKQIEGVIYDAEEQKWSKSVQISDTDSDVYHPQGVFDAAGDLQFLYRKTNSKQTDLCVLMKEKAVNLQLENAYCDETTFEPGSKAKVSVQIKNNGTGKVNGFKVDVDGTETAFTDTLGAGESTVVQADYEVPQNMTNREIKVKVNSDNESDMTDNQMNIQVGHTELAVNIEDSSSVFGQLTKIMVANESFMDTSATLEVHKNTRDGELLESIDLGNISKGQLVTTNYLWNKNTDNYSDDVEMLYFDVVSEKPEQYTNNNYDFVKVDDIEILLSSITASKTKTQYQTGDELSTDDITVKAEYSDGSKKEVTDYTTNVDKIDMSAAGDKTLEIFYEENGVTETTEIKITVAKKQEPSTTEPDTKEPSTTEPDTKEPDTTEPDTKEPSTTEPSTKEPSMTEPDTKEPDTTEPSTTNPGTDKPTVTEPNTEELTSRPTTKKSQKLKVTKAYTKEYGAKAFKVSAKLTKGNGKITYLTSSKKVATVSSSGKVTIKGTGICTITVQAKETATYKKATAKITITVKPKKNKVVKLKAAGGKTLNVVWVKDTKCAGYEIQCSTSKKFAKPITINIKKNKTTSYKIRKLSKGKKYYVRVRAYQNVKVKGKAKKLYGGWSTARQSGKIK